VAPGEESAVCANPRETACSEKIDEAKIFGQLQHCHGTGVEIGARNGGRSGRDLAGLDESTVRIFRCVEDTEGVAGRTIGIIEAVLSAGTEVDGSSVL
jgi:hypothetical protein